jgi:hypothetical protein
MLWESLKPLAASLGHSPLGLWLGKSTGRIAGLLTFHLFGLTILEGSLFVSSLHLMGLIQRGKPVAAMARDLRPAIAIGLTLMLGSGFLIFTGGAVEYYDTPWFRTKMEILSVALLFHFFWYRRVTAAEAGQLGRATYCLTGALTLLLWFGVAFAGRAIGYF